MLIWGLLLDCILISLRRPLAILPQDVVFSLSPWGKRLHKSFLRLCILHFSFDAGLWTTAEVNVTSDFCFNLHVLPVPLLLALSTFVHVWELTEVLVLNSSRPTKILLQAPQNDSLVGENCSCQVLDDNEFIVTKLETLQRKLKLFDWQVFYPLSTLALLFPWIKCLLRGEHLTLTTRSICTL